MNCPSRADPIYTEGWNQNPDALNADATTRADLNHMANARLQRDHCIDPVNAATAEIEPSERHTAEGDGTIQLKTLDGHSPIPSGDEKRSGHIEEPPYGLGAAAGSTTNDGRKGARALFEKAAGILRKYAKFVGPGFMVAVAYIDPGRFIHR